MVLRNTWHYVINARIPTVEPSSCKWLLLYQVSLPEHDANSLNVSHDIDVCSFPFPRQYLNLLLFFTLDPLIVGSFPFPQSVFAYHSILLTSLFVSTYIIYNVYIYTLPFRQYTQLPSSIRFPSTKFFFSWLLSCF